MKTKKIDKCMVTPTLRRMLSAAANREEITIGVWIRREIEKDIEHSQLDDFTYYKWYDSFTEELPQIAVSSKMETAINDRVEYLYDHPSSKGWHPINIEQYVRAICENGVNVSDRYRIPVWGKPQVDLIVHKS